MAPRTKLRAGACALAVALAACSSVQDFTTPPPGASEGVAAPAPAPACGVAASDPESCGSCGHSCLGGACTLGVCQPVVLALDADGPTALAVDATHVYWTNAAGAVKRVPRGGGESCPENCADRESRLDVPVPDLVSRTAPPQRLDSGTGPN